MRYFIVVLLFNIFTISAGYTDTTITYFTIAHTAEPLQIDKNGEGSSGIVTDIFWKIMKKREDISVKELTRPFIRMQREMLLKTEPNWINYGAKKWDGPQSWRLSTTPIFTAKNLIITKPDVTIKSVKDLFGKRLILIRGFGYPGLHKYIRQKKINVAWVENYQAAVTAVKLGRGLGFVGMDQRLYYTIKQLNLKRSNFKFNDISFLIPDYDIYFSFSKEFPDDIYEFINRELKLLSKSGEIIKIIDKYTK